MTAAPVAQATLLCSVGQLKAALSYVGGAILDKPTIPALENALFVSDERELTVTGSDLAITQTTIVYVECNEPFSVCVPHKTLLSLLNTIPEQPIRLIVSPETFAITLRTETGSFSIAGENPINYPKPLVDEEEMRQIVIAEDDHADFSYKLGNTLFAVAPPGRSLEWGEGVCWRESEVVASNGFMFSRMKQVPDAGKHGCLIPTRAATLIAKLLDNTRGEINVSLGSKRIVFSVDGKTIESPLSEYRFPDYQMGFPINSPVTWETNRFALINTLRRVLVLGNQTSYKVVLTGQVGAGITITASDIDFNQQGEDKVSATINQNLSIGVSGKHLIECLQHLTGEMATISLWAADRPLLISADSENEVMLLGALN
jgi:DNA polymerase-3 subunit beta